MILIVSYPDEDHTMKVVEHLNNAGMEVGILNFADFPSNKNLLMSWDPIEASQYIVNGQGEKIDFSGVKVVWWRRIVDFGINEQMSDSSDQVFASSETSQAIYGLLETINCPWINPLHADEAAHKKPYQWEIAKRVGLSIPKTIVTNDPIAAKEFINKVGIGKVVFKAFIAMAQSWRETRLIEQNDLDRIDSVKYAPVIFQEYIDGVDLRITFIGDKLFTGEIDARETSYPVDMRMVLGEAKIKPVELPDKVKKLIIKFMRATGLVYGAIDMKRTNDGEYVFLEINPAGQWLFVEQYTGLPISQAIADHLINVHNK